MEQPPPPFSPAAAAAAEPPSPSSPASSPFSPTPQRRRGQRRRNANANASPFSSRTGPLPSLLALVHALALAALVVYECIVGFPLAQDWRDAAAASTNGPSSSLSREADALWWLSLISAIALLLFLVLGFMARLALALLPAAGRTASMLRPRRQQPAQLPRQVVSPTAPTTTATPTSPLKRRLLTAAAWLPAGVIACVDFARLVVLASGNNKRRLGSPPVDCAAGPSPQDETREAFHPASPGGLSAPTCDRFRMAVVLGVTSVCFILLSLLWRATPRRPLSRLVLAPALSVVAAALLLAKPVTSLMLFVYVQREAFSRSAGGAGGGGGSIGGGGNGDPWPGELVLALISLLLASLGAVFVVMAALALGAPWALCAAAERLAGWRNGGARGGKRLTTEQQQQEAEMVAAAAAEEREEAAPPSGAVGPVPGVPEPGPYPRPGTAATTTAATTPPKETRRRSLAATLAALLALILLATQLPAAFGLIAPVVALSSFSNLWSNFWVDLDFAFGIAGIALFSLAVVAAVAKAAMGGGRGGDDEGEEGEAATAAV